MFLVDKTDVSWWTMQTQEGKQGLVPVNYIDKLEDYQEAQERISPATPANATPTTNNVAGSSPTNSNGVAQSSQVPAINHVNSSSPTDTLPDEVGYM